MERQQETRMRGRLRVMKMEREAQNRKNRKEEGREKADFLETLVKKKKKDS